MRATIRDIARVAGVSVATASLAVNGKAGVNALTRQRVLDAVEKLQYSPNQYARSLITKKTGVLGLVVTDLTNPFFGTLANEINGAALARGYNLLLGVSNDDADVERRIVDEFIGQRVEGVIMVPCAAHVSDIGHVHRIKTLRLPFVMATTAYPGIETDCVMTDLARGSFLLTDYLLSQGCRRIFLISGYRELLLSKLRIDGYRRAFREHGIQFSEDWIVETRPHFENGYEAARGIIGQQPDAIAAINDVLALGALKCLKDNRLRVPEDVCVAGYDDLLYTSILETPLTTVRQPLADIARECVELLLRRIGGYEGPAETRLAEPALVVRATTRLRETMQIQSL